MDPGTHGSNGASNVHMNPCPDGIQKSPHGIIILFILYETHYNNVLFLLGGGGGAYDAPREQKTVHTKSRTCVVLPSSGLLTEVLF